jgi:hypothetical protein
VNAGGNALTERNVSERGHGLPDLQSVEDQSQATPGLHANKKTASQICLWLFAAFRGEFLA